MRIIIAFDGSAGATDAVTLVEGIDWPTNSVIRVVSVFEPIMTPISGSWAGGAALASEFDESMTAYAKDAMHEVLERLRSSERSVEGKALHGRPADAIIDDARDFHADLVVVGSRGHGTI